MINVFVEALGLVAIAYATFAVVSFLEIRNKYQGSETSLEEHNGRRGVSLSQEERNDEGFLRNQEQEKGSLKGKQKKKRGRKKGGASVPRACLPLRCCPGPSLRAVL